MAVPRRLIVDPSVTPYYHCISRCVRRTIITDGLKRKIVERMRELAEVFTIDTSAYAILDTHMHQLVRIDEKRAKNLTRSEVLRRWAKIHPPRGADGQPLADLKQWLKEKLKDHVYVNTIRRRLCSLSWYMKELKEWSAKVANSMYREDGVFWSGRFKSIAILDKAALLATNSYIDLNPFAAGICSLPEKAVFTSIHERLSVAQGTGDRAAVDSCSADWLCPLDGDGSVDLWNRTGIFEQMRLETYLRVIDQTSRLPREGKACLDRETTPIFERLATNAAQWVAAFESFSKHKRPIGVYFSFERQRLRSASSQRGSHHVANLNGCATDVRDDER